MTLSIRTQCEDPIYGLSENDLPSLQPARAGHVGPALTGRATGRRTPARPGLRARRGAHGGDAGRAWRAERRSFTVSPFMSHN